MKYKICKICNCSLENQGHWLFKCKGKFRAVCNDCYNIIVEEYLERMKGILEDEK